MFEITSSGASQAIAVLSHKIDMIDGMDARLDEASDYVYDMTRHRFDTEGEGDWPALAESTVAKKISQGYGEPERILYAEGNLYESATSPYGPYSQRLHVNTVSAHSVVMLVDWENSGWQIPSVLAEGSSRGLPARPIWPPVEQVRDRVREILMRGF